MEWSKLKNIIILLLLLLNLFFLILVGERVQQRNVVEESMKQSTIELLNKNGILISKEMVPWDSTSKAYVTQRDRTEEERIAHLVLKEMKEQTQGLGVEYIGEQGLVQFYPDGRFLIRLHVDQEDEVADQERYAVNYLRKLGLQVKPIAVQTDGTIVKITMYQTLDQLPIFTCKMEAEFQDGRLSTICGCRLMGQSEVSNELNQGLSASDLLVRFMGAVMDGEFRCTEIRSIEQGYLYSSGSLSSKAKLTPVWLFETDQGEQLLNCMTGERETYPESQYAYLAQKPSAV